MINHFKLHTIIMKQNKMIIKNQEHIFLNQITTLIINLKFIKHHRNKKCMLVKILSLWLCMDLKYKLFSDFIHVPRILFFVELLKLKLLQDLLTFQIIKEKKSLLMFKLNWYLTTISFTRILMD